METVTHIGRATAYVHSDGHTDAGGDEGGGAHSRTEEEGVRGSTVLFVHGSGAAHDVWTDQIEGVDRWPVAALDLSGHGESDDVDATPGYAALSAYADDVLAVADAVDARVLVGNSLGGAVVMHVLLERDSDVEAAVLTGTGARLGVLEDLLTWLETDFERAIEFLHGPDRLFHDPDTEAAERSAETMRATGRDVTYRDFLTCHRFDVRDDLSEIEVPTLVVYGEYDQLTPPWFHEFLADEIPRADLVEIDDAAQLSMAERPAAFTEALEAFLESTLS